MNKHFTHSYPSARSLGWDEMMGQTKRRRVILEACKGNAMKASRILQHTARRGGNSEAGRKARNDANYFIRMWGNRKERKHNQRGK